MEFKEYMIQRKKTAKESLIVFFAYLLATVVNIFIFGFCMKPPFGSFVLLIIVGVYYFTHILTSRLNKEFEYIFTKDNIDIDVIMNKSKRKRLISFTVNQIEVLASVKDEAYNNTLKGAFDKTIDATSGNKDANVYFAVVDKNGRNLVKFEPSYTILESLNKIARSKIHIYE